MIEIDECYYMYFLDVSVHLITDKSSGINKRNVLKVLNVLYIYLMKAKQRLLHFPLLTGANWSNQTDLFPLGGKDNPMR